MLSWYKWPILCIVAELRMEIWTLGCQEWGWYRQNCFSRATVFYIFMKSKWKNVWFFWVVKEKNRKIPVSMYFAFTPAMIYEYMPQGHPNAKKKKCVSGLSFLYFSLMSSGEGSNAETSSAHLSFPGVPSPSASENCCFSCVRFSLLSFMLEIRLFPSCWQGLRGLAGEWSLVLAAIYSLRHLRLVPLVLLVQ